MTKSILDSYNGIMDKQIISPNCKTCKYFNQHYVKLDTKFMATNCGHCFNRNLTPREKRNFPFLNGCDLWEQQEINLDERNKTIENIIRNINERLQQIYEFLNAD